MMVDAAGIAPALLNALPHPVLLLGAENGIVDANPAAEGFFRTGSAQLRRKTLDELVPFGSPIFSLVEQVRAGGASVVEYRVDLGSPQIGSGRLVDVYASVPAEMPKHVCVMLLARSVTETIDRQLTHRGAARTVTSLAEMLAHEIKNPLAGIRGAAQLLEASGSEDDRVLTRLICDEADRIVRLVERMDAFSDERPIERTPVNIHAVLERVKTLAASGLARGVRITERYDPSLPPVHGNQDQLVQVFVNLVKNAGEALAGTAKPEIVIGTAYRPGIRLAVPGVKDRVVLPLEFSIADNGPGVPPDLLPHLFDPFVTTKTNGTGLGLALVAKIVRDHGGVIECDSRPGRTLFRILMPAWKADGTGKAREAAPVGPAPFDRAMEARA